MGVTKAINFEFSVTNNVDEYEAPILGLELARTTDIKSLTVYSDLNLLLQQMNKEYEVGDATLKKYVETAKELIQALEQLHIEKVPRVLNTKPDALSKSAK